jgi:hypothetical protein
MGREVLVMKLSLIAAMGVVLGASGCLVMPPPQGATGPSDPTVGTTDPSAASPSAPTTGAAAPKVPSAPQPMIPTSLEVHSDCPKTVGVFLGEKPGFSSGTRSSVGSNTTTTFPRKPDGSLTFWVLDDKDNGVTATTVSASTKRLTIDASCKGLSGS